MIGLFNSAETKYLLVKSRASIERKRYSNTREILENKIIWVSREISGNDKTV